MTRLGDFLTLGNSSKPLAANNLSKSLIFLGNFCKGVKIFNFFVKSFLGNFYGHLATFTGQTDWNLVINGTKFAKTRFTNYNEDRGIRYVQHAAGPYQSVA